jgi:hypothetical protein
MHLDEAIQVAQDLGVLQAAEMIDLDDPRAIGDPGAGHEQ